MDVVWGDKVIFLTVGLEFIFTIAGEFVGNRANPSRRYGKYLLRLAVMYRMYGTSP